MQMTVGLDIDPDFMFYDTLKKIATEQDCGKSQQLTTDESVEHLDVD